MISTAGLPGSIFPSLSWPSQRTSFHEGPKAAFISFPKVLTSCSRPWDRSKIRVSAHFQGKKKTASERHVRLYIFVEGNKIMNLNKFSWAQCICIINRNSSYRRGEEGFVRKQLAERIAGTEKLSNMAAKIDQKIWWGEFSCEPQKWSNSAHISLWSFD